MKAENYRFICNEVACYDGPITKDWAEKVMHHIKTLDSIMRAAKECADYFNAKMLNEVDIDVKFGWLELLERELKEIDEFKLIYRHLLEAASNKVIEHYKKGAK